jgi:signal-transduction protein with cAMP-binding, CBS, and nucleotidyltransferase domain
MTLVEKILALKTMPPFDRLRDSEVALIASAATVRHFAPGQLIHCAGEPFARFHLLVQGSWESAPGPLPSSLGVASLLFDQAALAAVTAGPDGARCLVIGRSHFHTIVTECPDILLGYLASPEGGPPKP